MILHKFFGQIAYSTVNNLVWRLPSKQKTLYLTFDDGPYPEATAQILKILNEFKVPATFFISGHNLFRFRRKADSLDYTFHKLANHGYYHHAYTLRPPEVMKNEILLTDRLIRRLLGTPSTLFRPPFGIFGPGLNKGLSELGKDLVLWSVMSNDYKWEAERVNKFLQKQVAAGDIIVFHDSPKSWKTTIDVLPVFIQKAIKNEYRFLTL